MSIIMRCECGHQYSFHDRYAGTFRKCLYCGREFTIPGGAPERDSLVLVPSHEPAPAEIGAPLTLDAEPTASNFQRVQTPSFPDYTPAARSAPPPPATLVMRPNWGRRYWILVVALVPLTLSSFHKDNFDLEAKVKETLKGMSDEQKEKFAAVYKAAEEGHASQSDVIYALPGHKLKGALLPANSYGHWAFALVSAVAFLLTIMLFLPSNTTTPAGPIVTAVFTGTIGILLLLVAQWLAFNMPWVRGGNVIALILLTLKCIGYAYYMALSSDTGFILSLIGFVFGVGLCEEICKALPVLHHYTTFGKKMDWRGACLWGLASGVGFGVSEGITYSSDYYNGLMGGNIYLIRFISCVALHAIWAGSSSVSLWKRQDELRGAAGDSYWEFFFKLIQIVFPLMVMHGLYDALLKFEQNILAMLVALASFAYFGWVVESAKVYEREAEPKVRTG